MTDRLTNGASNPPLLEGPHSDVSQSPHHDAAPATPKKPPLNSKWRGVVALYSTAALIGGAGGFLFNKAAGPTVDNNGNAKTGMTAEQMADHDKSYGKMSREEKLRLFNTTISKNPAPATPQSPSEVRMAQHASSVLENWEEQKKGLFSPLTWAAVTAGIAGLMSRRMKKNTGLSMEDHIHGPRDANEKVYNDGLKAKEKNQTATRGFEAARQERSDREIPYQWFPGGESRVTHVEVPGNITGYLGGQEQREVKLVPVPKPGTTRGEQNKP